MAACAGPFEAQLLGLKARRAADRLLLAAGTAPAQRLAACSRAAHRPAPTAGRGETAGDRLRALWRLALAAPARRGARRGRRRGGARAVAAAAGSAPRTALLLLPPRHCVRHQLEPAGHAPHGLLALHAAQLCGGAGLQGVPQLQQQGRVALRAAAAAAAAVAALHSLEAAHREVTRRGDAPYRAGTSTLILSGPPHGFCWPGLHRQPHPTCCMRCASLKIRTASTALPVLAPASLLNQGSQAAGRISGACFAGVWCPTRLLPARSRGTAAAPIIAWAQHLAGSVAYGLASMAGPAKGLNATAGPARACWWAQTGDSGGS